MADRLIKDEVFCLNAKAGTGVGTSISVSDFRHIILKFSSDTSADLTCKFQGSASTVVPTFSSAQSTSNHWDYVAVNDLQDSATIAGDTGIALTGTDDVRILEVNVDALKWFNAEITARNAGSATVKVIGFSNA